MKKRIQFPSAILGGVCFIVWMGCGIMGGEDWLRWLSGGGFVVCLGALIGSLFLRDALPDVLGESGLDYLEKDGFCFQVGLCCIEGVTHLAVPYQNRNANRCVVRLVCIPKQVHRGLGIAELKIQLECPGGGHGSVAFPWLMDPKISGEIFKCKLGVDVDYPEGKGSELRSRQGRLVGSVDSANLPEVMEWVASATEVMFQVPQGLKVVTSSPSTANRSIPPAGVSAGPKLDPPACIESSTAHATVTGSREVLVACEHCAHHYTYTLTREVTKTVEDSDQARARQLAQEQAEEELKNQLATDSDVVPCPQCGKLSARMRQARMQNRKAGVVGVGIGIGLSVVGAIVLLLVYWIGEVLHRLYYVVGLLAAGLVLFGLIVSGFSLYLSITGNDLPKK